MVQKSKHKQFKEFIARQALVGIQLSMQKQTLGILGPMGHGCGELQMAARVLII
jgi:hypothetical protein